MDKNKLNHNADRGSNKQQQLYLNIAFFGVFACAALIFLLLAFDKIPPVSEHKKAEKETLSIRDLKLVFHTERNTCC